MMGTTKKRSRLWITMLLTISLMVSFTTTAMAATPSDATASDLETYNAIRNWRTMTKSVQPPSTYDEVYDRIIACMDIIPQGTVWTDFMPYGGYTVLSPHAKNDPSIGYLGGAYTWNGGVIRVNDSGRNSQSGTGCAAFAFMISDAAFGSMASRVVRRGDIKLEDVHPGDILRDVNNTHFVIVLQTTEDGAIIAEANVKLDSMSPRKIGKVNWHRTMSRAEVEYSTFMITRYVEGQDYNSTTEEVIVKEGQLDSVHWSLNSKGVLSFTGSGAIRDFATCEETAHGVIVNETFERPWETATDDGKAVPKVSAIKIGSGITQIGNYAFYQSTALSVSIPNTVTSIGIRAFAESKLISVSIPNGTIGYEAFCRCGDIKTLGLCEGVTSIGDNAFCACSGISTDLVTPFVIPASVQTIGKGAFASCSSIYRLEFAPNSQLTTIGETAFTACMSLLVIELPQGLTNMESNLFQNSSMLWKLYIPASVTDIEMDALQNTPWMQVIYYGGTREQWVNAGGDYALKQSNPPYSNIEVFYNTPLTEFPSAAGEAHTTHSWSSDYEKDENAHWHVCLIEATICSITDPTKMDGFGLHVYDDNADVTCNTCGYVRTISTTPGEKHTHDWSEDWSNDGSYHWHECTATDCNVSENAFKEGYGTHTFGSWVTDTEATADTEGTKHRTCIVCEYAETGTIPMVTDPEPGETHTHDWSEDWSNDSSYHWHECTAPDCNVSENAFKEGYETHTFGSWVTDTEATTDWEGTKHRTCIVCEYTETETIPKISNRPSYSNPSGGSSNTGGTTNSTKINPDGTVTIQKRDNRTGTVTETTKRKDGSVMTKITETNGKVTMQITEANGTVNTEVIEPNGTRTTEQKNVDGSKRKTVSNPDGSQLITSREVDGTTTSIDVSTNGKVNAEVNLSRVAVENNPRAVNLPIPDVTVTSNNADAPVVTVNWSANAKDANIVVPLAEPNTGVVAVIVKDDGSEEIVHKSALVGDNLVVPLSGNATIKIIDKSTDFVDVSSNHWASDAVAFATSHDLFKGVGDNKFAPNVNMSRSMLVTVLYRLENTSASYGAVNFQDVDSNAWYADALQWAAANQIVSGYGDGMFRPDDNVTREQIAVILYRYANKIGVKTTEQGAISQFHDGDKVSAWASDAMSWAVGAKLFSGDGKENLNPLHNATRAEVATILMRFAAYMAK